MNTSQWQPSANASPKRNMHSSSMHDAMHPNPNALRNSTFQLSNISQTSSLEGNENHKVGSHQKQNQNVNIKSTVLNTSSHTSAPAMTREGSLSPTKCNENEVDYYHNPTELFRWINYRRWDGARARVNSNPEECGVWVVSRHSNDGRILWKQLPLHLVCMQTGILFDFNTKDENRDEREVGARSTEEDIAIHNANLKQVEDMVDELLDAYPEAASLQDDQGMLPLHLCVNSVDYTTGPNEKVLSLLLLAHANALYVKDRYGRTPIDILREKSTGVPGAESALKLMLRAQVMARNIKDGMAKETQEALREMKQHAENERQASQRIIRRLEQELADEQNRAEKEVSSAGEERETSKILREELRSVKQNYATVELDLDQVRKERDDLVTKNEMLRNEIDNQEHIVAQIRRETDKELDEHKQVVASFRSEASTARAMAEGMEAQLRSKFTNEEDLKNAVSKLQKEISGMKSQSKRETKKLIEDIDRLEDELKHSASLAEEFSKKNEALERSNRNLDKHLGQVLVSYNSLSSEYDQLFDSSNRNEVSIMESIKNERSNIAASLEKQKKLFDATIAEQKRLMAETSQKEAALSDMISQERKREREAVSKLKEGFQEVRAQLSAKHCIMTEPVNKSTGFVEVKSKDPFSLVSPKILEQQNTLHESGNQVKENFLEPGNAFRAGREDTVESKPSTDARATDMDLDKPRPAESYRSPGLLTFLEERAQNSSRRHPRSVAGLRDFQTTSSLLPSSSSRASSNNRDTPSTTRSFDEGMKYLPNSDNSHGIMRNRSMQHVEEHDDDFICDSQTSRQGSFSLDEYSDVASRTSSSNLSTFGDQRDKPYRGMRAAINKGMIRLGDDESIDGIEELRKRYSSHQNS